MRKLRTILAIGIVASAMWACGTDNDSTKDEPEVPETPTQPSEPEKPETPETPETPEKPDEPETPTQKYELKASMIPDASLVGAGWREIDTYMKKLNFEYTEHSNNVKNPADDHYDGTHAEVEYDSSLNMYVYKLSIHKNDQVIDGDRGTKTDRQRNEMKSRTSGDGFPQINGNYDEWQRLEWKFKIPAGFQPSGQFTHIHQLKGADGSDNGSPLITISLRSNSKGTDKRVQVIHVARSGGNNKGNIVDNVPLSEFEDEWVQVVEECHYRRHGHYYIKITRIRDGKVLIEHSDSDIDLWRAKGGTAIRNKYGIYRSVGKDPFGSNTLLKDEHIYLTDFKIYEKNTNPNPSAVED